MIAPQRGTDHTPYLHHTLALIDGAPDSVNVQTRAAILAVGALYEHDLRTGDGATGSTPDEIADLLGWQRSTAERWLYRAASVGLLDRNDRPGVVRYVPVELGEGPDRG